MLKRAVIFIHRWLGVALCLFFLLWFPSGIVMMYWDFPSVTPFDRLKRSSDLDSRTIALSAAEAFAKLDLIDPPDQVRLVMFDGRPVYRFGVGRGEAIVYADTGEQQSDVSVEMMQRVAAAWVGQPAVAAEVESIEEVDQWMVGAGFRNLKPISRYSWPDGQQVYVSQTNGEVVQYTTRSSRFWAYLGAIPHWLYFTPLRKHGPQWSTVVIWSSGVGTFAALVGIVVGIWMYSPSRRYRYAGAATSIPYRGQKRWHMVLGLLFGLGAATWAFSGMLSMDPFPMSGRGGQDGQRASAGAGILRALYAKPELAAFGSTPPGEVLSKLADVKVKALDLRSVLGEPVYLATLSSGDTRIVPPGGEPQAELSHQRLMDFVTTASQPAGLAEITVLGEYDRYYLDRRRARPLPVILARLGDAEHTRYYIDPKTARVVSSYSSDNWVSRWLYHALHSLDFPWLYNHRPLWDLVVITFMVGGTALCLTSLVLAWRVVGRKLTLATGRTRSALNEDLVSEAR